MTDEVAAYLIASTYRACEKMVALKKVDAPESIKDDTVMRFCSSSCIIFFNMEYSLSGSFLQSLHLGASN